MKSEDLKNIKDELLELNSKVLFEYENSTTLKQVHSAASQSHDAFNSFVYFLQLFVKAMINYIELYTKYKEQVEMKCNYDKFALFFSISVYEILYPFPFLSWNDFVT